MNEINIRTTPSFVPKGVPVSKRGSSGDGAISNLLLLALGIFFVLPLLWLVVASVDSGATQQLQWPHLTIHNFAEATSPDKAYALLNSLILSCIATAVSTVPAIFAAYAFSRYGIPAKNTVLMSILFLSGVPISILIVPVYQLFQVSDLLSLAPAAVFLGVTALPFEIYIIKNAVDAVPLDLEESARLERAGTLRIIMKVIIPISIPGIVAAAVYGFINAWGSFLVPLVLIASSDQQPAPIAIFSFVSADVIRYGDIAAYSLVYSVPVIILYLVVSRVFRGGFAMSGAVK
jgi:multiple sugar transport system permease protein